MSDVNLSRLAKLDSCAISDALDALQIKGVALGLCRLGASRKIVGSCVTVQLGPKRNDDVPGRHLGSAAVERSGPGDVIVVANDGRIDVAAWGGLLSLAANIRRIEGVVIDGALRDLDDTMELGFSVYARSSVPITARGRIVEYGWDVPVDIAGICVEPRDLVLADGSGVVFIPGRRIEEVLDRAESLADKERSMAQAIAGNESILTVMNRRYETLI